MLVHQVCNLISVSSVLIFALLSMTSKCFVKIILTVLLSQLSISSEFPELFHLLVPQILNLLLVKRVFHAHCNLMVQLLFSLDLDDLLLSKSSLILVVNEFVSVVSKCFVMLFSMILELIHMTGLHRLQALKVCGVLAVCLAVERSQSSLMSILKVDGVTIELSFPKCMLSFELSQDLIMVVFTIMELSFIG